MLAEKEAFYFGLVDEIAKTAKYLHNQLAQPKTKPQQATPPNASFEVKAAQYSGFDLGEYAGISLPGPGSYVKPSYLPPFIIPPLLVERGKRKRAFTESAYSGGLGPYGRLKYESGIPSFQAPALKTAGPPAKEKKAEDEEPSRTPRLLAAGAAGLAPMTGMIGQQPIIHDPTMGAKGKKFRTMEEVSREAKPGDILLTTKPKRNIWKGFQSPFSGSEFYHVQPIVGKRKGHGVTVSSGEFSPGEFTTSAARRQADTVQKSMRGIYPDVTLLRPKQPLTPEQTKIFGEASVARATRKYDYPKAVESWARDVFVPKIKGVTGVKGQTICEGNVCSTIPSQALHEATGKAVVPGKRAQDVLPADFLRSKQYELIGSKVKPGRYLASPTARRAMPYLARGGLGVGLAGATYAGTRDPGVPGAVAGAAGAGALASTVAKHTLGQKATEQLPGAGQVLQRVMETEGSIYSPKTWGTVGQRFATRRLPVLAAGAGLGYLGAKKIQKTLRHEEPKEAAVNMAGGLTPAGRLQSARAVGAPRITAPPGPSIAEISKPIGYGKPLPGATKV